MADRKHYKICTADPTGMVPNDCVLPTGALLPICDSRVVDQRTATLYHGEGARYLFASGTWFDNSGFARDYFADGTKSDPYRKELNEVKIIGRRNVSIPPPVSSYNGSLVARNARFYNRSFKYGFGSKGTACYDCSGFVTMVMNGAS